MGLLTVFSQTDFLGRRTFQLFHHALATPITALFCTIAELENAKNSHNFQQLLKNLEVTTKRIDKLANIFLLSKGSAERTDFFIIPTLKSIISLFKYKKASITVICAASSPDTLTYCGNQILFEEALVCLITNALDSYEKTSKKIIIITIRQTNAILEILIRDYGKGIQWWQKPLIFLPKVTFKKNGNGLGLPFARSVFENHISGKIRITSSLAGGTEISCQLPLNPLNNIQTLG